MDISIIIIVLLIVICLFNSYTDIKTGLISNRILLIFGGAVVLLNLVNTFAFHDGGNLYYWCSMAAAILLSLVLYLFDIWAGGDCKFFSIIVLSIPFTYSQIDGFGISSAFVVIVVTFLISYIFLIIDSVIKAGLETRTINRRDLVGKAGKQFKTYLKVYFLVALLNYIMVQLFTAFGMNQQYYLIITVLTIFCVMLVIKTNILNSAWVVIALVSIDFAIGALTITTLFTKRTVVIWGAVILVALTKHFVDNYNYKTIPVKELKERMILTTESSILLSKLKGSRVKGISDESLASRLSKEDVAVIQNVCNKNSIEEVVVVKKIPLAAFMAISTILVIGSKVL